MNARRFLITATAVLVVASVLAQQKQGHASAPFKKNQGKMSVIDSTKLRVWYAMNADSILDMIHTLTTNVWMLVIVFPDTIVGLYTIVIQL